MTEAERVVEAVLAGTVEALDGVQTSDRSLQAVLDAARRRLQPALSEDAVLLLRTIAAYPGRHGAELGELSGLGERFAAASAELLAGGYVEQVRFGRPDVWTRTARARDVLG